MSGQAEIRAQNDQALQYLAEIRTTIAIGPIDTARSAFDQHLDAQIDQYRDMLNAGKPRTALGLLQALDNTLDEKSAVSVRARVKVNLAISQMKLGKKSMPPIFSMKLIPSIRQTHACDRTRSFHSPFREIW
ncbi:hypothetical protein [Acetobacter orientalis]|uniref:hypothetical protein n=1 Tax=Acetobacter orientalis TaxID=146474 RepID=UPI0039EC7430